MDFRIKVNKITDKKLKEQIMKPLVYFVDKVGKDNYVLTKEELNKILEEVYQAGYEDGLVRSKYTSPLSDWWKEVQCNGTENPKPLEFTY